MNNQAHNLLISEVRNSYRIPLWLDIGFAHWMEQREGFETNTYTFGEAGIKAQFANGDWRPALRKLVATARTPSLDDFFLDQTLGNYTGKMRGVCFGLVDYMIREHRDGFRAFCRGLRETEHGTREVFRESFHLSLGLLEPQLRAAVNSPAQGNGLVANAVRRINDKSVFQLRVLLASRTVPRGNRIFKTEIVFR